MFCIGRLKAAIADSAIYIGWPGPDFPDQTESNQADPLLKLSPDHLSRWYQ